MTKIPMSKVSSEELDRLLGVSKDTGSGETARKAKSSKKLDYLLDINDTIYTVHKLSFPNGKSYVGITKRRLSERWANGNGYKANTEMYEEIRKVGWDNVQKEIIKCNLTKCEAEQLETRLIKELDLFNPSKGYNVNVSFSPYLTKRQQVNQWKKENRDTLRIDLPKGMKAEIQAEAKARGCTVTDLIQQALTSYCSIVTEKSGI